MFIRQIPGGDVVQYKIKNRKIYGIRHGFLFLSGWVDSSAALIEVKDIEEVFYSIGLEPTKSKIYSFDIKTALSNTKFSNIYQVVVTDKSGKVHIIDTFKSTPLKRLQQKFQIPHYNLYIHAVDKRHKQDKKNTMNLRNARSYNYWIKKYETFHPVKIYAYQPKISIIIPVYNVDAKYLRICLDSILKQTYQNFEICIADDCSTKQETIDVLHEYVKQDNRIKVVFREKNGHISEASNSAFELATGEFIGMMDNDDELMPQALNEIVRVLNICPEYDFIYTDEDKIDLFGNRSDPQFKPDFAINKLYGGNYICHFNVIRKTIFEKSGGFRKGYEGAQDFDLFLRISKLTDRFYHIPKVLYHWRMIPGSTAMDSRMKNYAGAAGKKALEDYFEDSSADTQIDIVVNTHYSVEYILKEDPLIDIIVLMDQDNDNFSNFLNAIQEMVYKKYRLILIGNDEHYHHYFKDFKISYRIVQKQNQSLAEVLNNYLENDPAPYLLFTDSHYYLKTFDALNLLVGYAAQPQIGAVGAKIINKHLRISAAGYYLVNDHLLAANLGAYDNDYGHYGTLLVCNDYRIIEDVCFMVETQKIKHIEGFCNKLNDKWIFYDAFIRLYEEKFHNVIIPRVEVYSEKKQIQDHDEQALIEFWKKNDIDTVYDPYYNINLSDRAAFRLPRK